VIAQILAALDGSFRAPAVFSTAADLAVQCKARLHLVRVVEVPVDFPPAAHVAHPAAMADLMRRNAERELVELAGGRDGLVTTFSVVLSPEAWRAILEKAASLSVDLLVIGTHQRRGMERILGTTASRIVNHADRDLLIVHPRKEG
jgi:nucleotide-binding universal stress UspA family protein